MKLSHSELKFMLYDKNDALSFLIVCMPHFDSNAPLNIYYACIESEIFPVSIYLLKVNNRNTRTRCEICSKLTIKTPERRQATSDYSYYINSFIALYNNPLKKMQNKGNKNGSIISMLNKFFLFIL